MVRDSSLSPPSSPESNVELDGQEDHKSFRREEFEGKLRDMGLELEKDEEVSSLYYIINNVRKYSVGEASYCLRHFTVFKHCSKC